MKQKIEFEIRKIIKENKNINVEEIGFKCFLLGVRFQKLNLIPKKD